MRDKIQQLAIEIYYAQGEGVDISADDWVKRLEDLYRKGFEAGSHETAEQNNEINAIAKEGIRKGLIKKIKKIFKEVENPYGDFIGEKGEREKNAFEQARGFLLVAVLKIFK